MYKNTINGEEPWEYIELLNECITILLTVLIGIVFGYCRIFDAKAFVPHATKFVFYVALPLHVLRGLGIGVNFYDDKFSWTFIAIFLVLRAVCLVIALLTAIVQGNSIGHVAVIWLSLSWVSTIIMGIPISTAVFGDPNTGAFYGLLAAISSFIFQLPLQLLFLECHVLETESEAAQEDVEIAEADPKELPQRPPECAPLDGFIDTVEPGEQIEEIGATPEPGGETTSVVVKETQSTKEKLVTWLKLSRRGDIWRSILAKIICNPVIWGIVGGFILSLSTVGPTYLKPEPPPNENYVPGLGWIWSTTLWLGSCVSPVSLFTMGVWMQDQGRKLFLIPPLSVVLYMLAKLVVVPLIMMGLALAVNLDDNSGRAAVLIAALPISMASFTLGNRYKVGEAILAENIFMGTALLLPTILLWNLILDKVGLFPITKTGA